MPKAVGPRRARFTIGFDCHGISATIAQATPERFSTRLPGPGAIGNAMRHPSITAAPTIPTADGSAAAAFRRDHAHAIANAHNDAGSVAHARSARYQNSPSG